MRLLTRLHARLGDLWWYTILLFCVQRFGDVINMFVGLWLVPKYVSQQDLGAVLPLSQFVNLIGLPLGLVAVPFMKYLNVYSERNELGKIKSLLRDVFVGTGVLALLTFVIAYFLLPIVFVRMRVAAGSLGVLIVGSSIILAVSTIFQNAVQGLKLYSATVWFNALTAPCRLVLMLLFMPFRPLSGYFLGQGASPGVSVVGAIWVLRKKLGKTVKAVPYWKEDGRAMLRYAVPVALGTAFAVVGSSVEQIIIRHRLSDFDSAGYYMISRFADIATYIGSVFVVFLFPMVAGRKAKDAGSQKVLLHSVSGTTVGGLLVAVLLWFFGADLLGLQEHWKVYQSLSGHMAFLAVVNVSTVVVTCLSTYETAQGRFRYLWYLLPFIAFKSVGLYLLTGYTFFEGMVPPSWIRAVAMLDPCRLGFLLAVFLAGNLLMILCLCMDIFGSRKECHVA